MMWMTAGPMTAMNSAGQDAEDQRDGDLHRHLLRLLLRALTALGPDLRGLDPEHVGDRDAEAVGLHHRRSRSSSRRRPRCARPDRAAPRRVPGRSASPAAPGRTRRRAGLRCCARPAARRRRSARPDSTLIVIRSMASGSVALHALRAVVDLLVQVQVRPEPADRGGAHDQDQIRRRQAGAHQRGQRDGDQEQHDRTDHLAGLDAFDGPARPGCRRRRGACGSARRASLPDSRRASAGCPSLQRRHDPVAEGLVVLLGELLGRVASAPGPGRRSGRRRSRPARPAVVPAAAEIEHDGQHDEGAAQDQQTWSSSHLDLDRCGTSRRCPRRG